jgi:hypothetical protein
MDLLSGGVGRPWAGSPSPPPDPAPGGTAGSLPAVFSTTPVRAFAPCVFAPSPFGRSADRSSMATALVLDADGRRENGRWSRDTVDIPDSGNSVKTWRNNLQMAGVVLDWMPDLARGGSSSKLDEETGRARGPSRARRDKNPEECRAHTPHSPARRRSRAGQIETPPTCLHVTLAGASQKVGKLGRASARLTRTPLTDRRIKCQRPLPLPGVVQR